jgi:hypothetical protein
MKRMASPEPTTSSARISEDSPRNFPSRQRSQSQSTQQVKPQPGRRRSQTAAHVSSTAILHSQLNLTTSVLKMCASQALAYPSLMHSRDGRTHHRTGKALPHSGSARLRATPRNCVALIHLLRLRNARSRIWVVLPGRLSNPSGQGNEHVGSVSVPRMWP